MGDLPLSTIIEATLRTLALGASVALIAGLFGISMAWLVTRTQLSGRKHLASLLSIPYALPPFLLGMAWVVLGNPTVGLLKDVLPQSGSYGFWGMTFVLASVCFAFPYLELKAGFEKMDPALEEAGKMSGASPFYVFRTISFPLLFPALLNGMCLSFLYAIAAFGVPALLGLPVRKFVLTTLIYSQFRVGGMEGLSEGLKLSVILLVIAIILLILSGWLTRIQNKRGGALAGAKSSRPSLVSLGKWKHLATFFAWGFFTVTVILPWIALALSALAPIAGKFSPSLWTLKNLAYVLTLDDFKEGLFNSLILAFSVATTVVTGGFLLAFSSVRRKKRWATWVIETLGLPFSTPGTVIAIILIFASAWLTRMGLPFDSPLLLMAIAYGLKFSAVAARSICTAYRQVHPALEEAARVSGAKTWTLLKTIWFPLLKKNLFAAWLLALLPMFTELTMSILLTGPGGATLGTVLFQLQEYADQPSAAALAWMLLTIALFIGLMTRKKSEETT